MATAPELLRQLTDRLDAREWNTLAELLHPDFVCRYVHTGEVFDAPEWIRLNAGYPGFGRLALVDAVASGDRAVGRAHVTGESGGVTQHFEVASFITARDGLIAELTEVWTDAAATPPEGTRPQ